MLKSKTVIIFTLLTLICISVMIYVSKTSDSELNQNTTNSKPPSSVNFLVTNMKLVINNTDGSIKAKINTNKVKHNAGNNQTNLDHPHLSLRQTDGTLIITADNGKILHNKNKIKQIEKIILSNNVKIEKINQQNNTLPFIRLETDTITYLPKEDLVTTNNKVKIITENSLTTAKGLLFNKTTQKLQLLENVESKYSPNINENGWKISKLNKTNNNSPNNVKDKT